MPVSYHDRGPIDDAGLSRIHDLTFAGSISGITESWSARLHAHSVGWVCAYDDGQLVGFVHACWDGGKHAFLLDTTVVPKFQRQGIGVELVTRLTRQVTDAGCEWLHVDYEPRYEAFYRACGFQPTLAGLQRLR